ncbi:hypothetical protein BD779DRAFT_1476477 [Infundibulicybe gibba]|nr:hypothetical protein BD779DRAFT_1476477 [Infundibulicybe gibba]
MPVPQWMPNRSKTTALHPVDDDAWRGRSGCIGRWADGVDYTVANPVEANPGFGLPTLLELSRRRCRQMEFFLMNLESLWLELETAQMSSAPQPKQAAPTRSHGSLNTDRKPLPLLLQCPHFILAVTHPGHCVDN